MFSVRHTRHIADQVEAILRATAHPELPAGVIPFRVQVWGKGGWSFAVIENNDAGSEPTVNPWNEAQDPHTRQRRNSEERHVADRTTAFTYHRPSPEVQAIMTRLRESYQALGGVLDGSIPESREKSLAWTALEESAMWAMKALSVTDTGGVIIDPPAIPPGTAQRKD